MCSLSGSERFPLFWRSPVFSLQFSIQQGIYLYWTNFHTMYSDHDFPSLNFPQILPTCPPTTPHSFFLENKQAGNQNKWNRTEKTKHQRKFTHTHVHVCARRNMRDKKSANSFCVGFTAGHGSYLPLSINLHSETPLKKTIFLCKCMSIGDSFLDRDGGSHLLLLFSALSDLTLYRPWACCYIVSVCASVLLYLGVRFVGIVQPPGSYSLSASSYT